MNVEILDYIFDEKVSQDYLENIKSLIVVFGDPDCILVFNRETELGWYRDSPDRILEISVYEDDEVDFWFERCTFGADGKEYVETGEVGSSLRSLQEWLEDNNG